MTKRAATARCDAGWLRAVLALLLFALSWQSCVFATHTHQPTGPSGTPGAIVQRAPAHDRRAPAAPDSCPICQQIAIAAAYLPAPPVTFATPTRALVWFAASAMRDALPRQRSHGWRSRGPPAAPAFSS